VGTYVLFLGAILEEDVGLLLETGALDEQEKVLED
jgi:hypothetical protein